MPYLQLDMGVLIIEISGTESERFLLFPCATSDESWLSATSVLAIWESLSERILPSDSDLLIINLQKHQVSIRLIQRRLVFPFYWTFFIFKHKVNLRIVIHFFFPPGVGKLLKWQNSVRVLSKKIPRFLCLLFIQQQYRKRIWVHKRHCHFH